MRSTSGEFDHPWMGKEKFSCMGSGRGATELFLELRSRTIEKIITEREKTKRITLVLAAFLVISASTIVLYAPEGRETLAYYLGGVLAIISAGAIGYDQFGAKSKHFQLLASVNKKYQNDNFEE